MCAEEVGDSVVTGEILVETVNRYYSAIRALDTERYVALFAPGATVEAPAGATPVSGPDRLRELFWGLYGSIQTLDLTEQTMLMGVSAAAIKWTARARDAAGADVLIEGIDFIDLDETAHITEVRSYWNRPGPRPERSG